MSDNLEACTTLPEGEEMRRRLESVSVDPSAVELFYPLVLEYAGNDTTGWSVVVWLQLAINDYLAATLPNITGVLIQQRLAEYVTAIVDDETVRAVALGELSRRRAQEGRHKARS